MRLLWFAATAALATSLSGTINDAVYDVVDVILSSALPGCVITYRVLVVEVSVNGTLRLQPTEAQPDDVFAHSAFGTLDLHCGACRWSSRAVTQGRAHDVPTSLVPVEHASGYAVTAFASNLLFSKSLHGSIQRRGNKLRAVLFVRATPSAECASADTSTDNAGGTDEDTLRHMQYEDTCFSELESGRYDAAGSNARPHVAGCELHILPPAEQQWRGRSPGARYTVQRRGQTDETRELPGSIPLRRVRDAYQPVAADPMVAEDSRSSSGRAVGNSPGNDGDSGGDPTVMQERARLMEALRVGRSILRSAFPGLYGVPNTWRKALQAPAVPETAAPSPAGDDDAEGGQGSAAAARGERHAAQTGALDRDVGASETADAADLEAAAARGAEEAAAFLEVEGYLGSGVSAAALSAAGATAEAGLPGLSNMLKPILDGLLKPVTGVITGVMGDLLGDSIGNVLGGTVDSGLTAEVTALLSHALTTSLTESLVPPLSETLTDSVTNTFTPQFRDAITDAVSQQLTKSVSASVSQTLSRSLARQLEADVPDQLAEQLTDELTHYLTQSVTQAVVPALTYTLHHNPAEDYFCAYCNAYKLYCDYCRKDGPEQLYRSQYYAAYYSRYYADVYAKRQADMPPPAPPAAPAGGKKKA
jgi:hypothetical protein